MSFNGAFSSQISFVFFLFCFVFTEFPSRQNTRAHPDQLKQKPWGGAQWFVFEQAHLGILRLAQNDYSTSLINCKFISTQSWYHKDKLVSYYFCFFFVAIVDLLQKSLGLCFMDLVFVIWHIKCSCSSLWMVPYISICYHFCSSLSFSVLTLSYPCLIWLLWCLAFFLFSLSPSLFFPCLW